MSLEIVFPSFAKVNLFLEVTGKRADGYHDLFTLFQTVSLHDTVHLIERPGAREVWFSDPSIDPERNTVTKVLDLLGIREGLRVEVEKRIPSGGGLGGGSSNAGSVLLALNAHRNLGLSKGRLWEIASAVGADVPFFLFGGKAIGMGRGDILFPQEDGEKQYLVLNFPGVSLSTARIFSDLTEFGEMSRIYALFINGEGKRFVNRLEEPAFRIHPRLREEKAKMAEKSAFNKGFRQRGAVHHDEVFPGPGAVFMDGPGEKLLSRARFSGDEDVGVAAGGVRVRRDGTGARNGGRGRHSRTLQEITPGRAAALA